MTSMTIPDANFTFDRRIDNYVLIIILRGRPGLGGWHTGPTPPPLSSGPEAPCCPRFVDPPSKDFLDLPLYIKVINM